jgi:hypothetical protein
VPLPLPSFSLSLSLSLAPLAAVGLAYRDVGVLGDDADADAEDLEVEVEADVDVGVLGDDADADALAVRARVPADVDDPTLALPVRTRPLDVDADVEAYGELDADTDGDVPGVRGDVLAGGVLGEDADPDAYGNIDGEPGPEPLDFLDLGLVDVGGDVDGTGTLDVDGPFVFVFVFEGTRTRCVVPFCCCVDCIGGGSGKFCTPDVDAGERLDFAGTRRPEIVRARVVGGDAEALVVLFLLPLALVLGLEALAVRAEETPLGGRRCERGGGSGAGILARCSMPPASSCVPSPSLVQTQVKGSRSQVALTLGGEYESNQERGQRIRSYKSAA